MLDDVFTELGALELGRTFHQASEVIGHVFRTDGTVEAFDDEVCGFVPAHVAEHHFAGEHDGTRIDLVFVSILRCGAVSGFKDRVAGDVVDVATRCDADAANLCGESVGEVVAVEVESRDDVEICWACEHLLQGDVSDRVFDDDACTRFALGDHTPWATVDFDSAEFIFRTLIIPVSCIACMAYRDAGVILE